MLKLRRFYISFRVSRDRKDVHNLIDWCSLAAMVVSILIDVRLRKAAFHQLASSDCRFSDQYHYRKGSVDRVRFFAAAPMIAPNGHMIGHV